MTFCDLGKFGVQHISKKLVANFSNPTMSYCRTVSEFILEIVVERIGNPSAKYE